MRAITAAAYLDNVTADDVFEMHSDLHDAANEVVTHAADDGFEISGGVAAAYAELARIINWER